MRSGGTGYDRTYAEKKMEALKAKNTSILSYEELERIKSMCSQTNAEQDYKTMRQTERKDLHQISQGRVSKWPNTIQAERERKEYERVKKLEDDEVSSSPIVSFFLRIAPCALFMRSLSFSVTVYLILNFFPYRLREEESMPRRRPTSNSSDKDSSIRPIRCSMTTRTWLRPFTARCFSVMSWPNKMFKEIIRRDVLNSIARLSFSGKSLRNKK